MSVIYEPKGKAREYSPLALNLYLDCSHGCKYCYAPAIMRKGEGYYKVASPRNNIIKLLEKDLERNAPKSQVLLSFIGDVYSQTVDDNLVTRQALTLLSKYHVPTAVLTKGGQRCLKDMDIFNRKMNCDCGLSMSRDQNAAINILREGLRLLSEAV